jgi:hypothetical protein
MGPLIAAAKKDLDTWPGGVVLRRATCPRGHRAGWACAFSRELKPQGSE